ncbi:long-chain fatty acid--CoA ligase [Paraburkholderia ginsengiterrae]|uniref:Long-chain fatty acid--CoA ligase n=1 Tax=Paraburkholderia ginsengiterrae TaxID=1462993 RepID=A0A1A9N8Z9_9BURK|nr:long-chain fatty acid--CoA ligase [Paraburkholderia ginsengiterrae]OAJ54968.1 long-chain fatty acid--CoA ligase [Paraburkholderia ginsengiterrae]OAJ61151.1 long-chain fatty acid--CoA ligase [Paraburkholderia ginsengiterrae]
MENAVTSHWPAHLQSSLTIPETNLFHNVEVSAARFPEKPAIIFYDTPITFAQVRDEAEFIAGYLQNQCGVRAGDRVLLYMQNSPQWVIACYGILRANAVVVPVNAMNTAEELRHYVEDSGAETVLVAQDLFRHIQPLLRNTERNGLQHVIVATYSDYLKQPPSVTPPDFVTAARNVDIGGAVAWADALAARYKPGALTAGPDDLCVMPYTSGTTGKPKGCMHTHRSVMHTALASVRWVDITHETTLLTALPLFHVTGMQSGMNGPLSCGATIVLMSRWDRDIAARMIERYQVAVWSAISTMMVDFLSNPKLREYDLSSLRSLRGGGAAMPAALVKKLKDTVDIDYVEGYGMSETISATHFNPPQRPKAQCLGIPMFDVDARVIDPEKLGEVAQGQAGEIVVHGRQVMQGYWRNPDATREAFIEIDGKRFLRTGDLARVDEEGYYFMTDRLKRMINASGYKVWPAEVEALMYQHEAIREVCVIGASDSRRGETVKALVVLDPGHVGNVTDEDIIAWARNHMASYKVPRIVEFVRELPKSASGKILWRQLQENSLATL